MDHEMMMRTLVRMCQDQGIDEFICIVTLPIEGKSENYRDTHMLTNIQSPRQIALLTSMMTTKAITSSGPDQEVDIPDKDH